MTKTLLDYALEAVRRGWYVFPCKPKSKLPNGALVHHGALDASNDEAQIRLWWGQAPNGNYGIVMALSNLSVLDVDHGFVDTAHAKTWAEQNKIPTTYVVRTGRTESIGFHFYFQGAMPSNSKPFTLDGVSGDVKSGTGYVIGSGCVHPSGKLYRVVGDHPPAAVPSLIAELIPAQPKVQLQEDKSMPERLTREQIFSVVGRETKKNKHQCPRCKEFHFEVNENTLDFNCWTPACEGKATEIAALIWREVKARSKKIEDAEVINVVEIEQIKNADMPESVLDGKLGKLCRENLIAIGLPVAYAWLATVVIASLLIPRSGQTFAREDQLIPVIRACLFATLVGSTQSGKNVAIEYAAKMLGVNLYAPPVFRTRAGSAEGLAKAIGDQHGNPVLWFIEEMSVMLKKAAIQNASFPEILQELYSNDTMTFRIVEQKVIEFNARLSILGAIPDDKFQAAFTSELVGGFWQRQLFALLPTGHKYLYRPYEGKITSDWTLASCCYDPGVWEARDAYVARTPDCNTRIIESCLRVAGVCASFDGRGILRAEDLGPTWALCDYQHQIRKILKPGIGVTYDAKAADRIRTCLKRHTSSGAWMTQRILLHNIETDDLGPKVFKQTIDALVQLGDVERLEKKPPHGGPTKTLLRISEEESVVGSPANQPTAPEVVPEVRNSPAVEPIETVQATIPPVAVPLTTHTEPVEPTSTRHPRPDGLSWQEQHPTYVPATDAELRGTDDFERELWAF